MRHTKSSSIRHTCTLNGTHITCYIASGTRTKTCTTRACSTSGAPMLLAPFSLLSYFILKWDLGIKKIIRRCRDIKGYFKKEINKWKIVFTCFFFCLFELFIFGNEIRKWGGKEMIQTITGTQFLVAMTTPNSDALQSIGAGQPGLASDYC